MSDNEVINRPHSPEESSGDESSSEVTNNGFSHDGEPVNRPRKDSSSSSSSESPSEDNAGPKVVDSDDDDDESVSKSISKSESKSEDYSAEDILSKSEKSDADDQVSKSSGVEQPPQPKSRSVSVEEVVSPPAPAERKVSVASEKSVENKADHANDTDDDVEDEEIEEVKDISPAAPPIPVVRKVSVPAATSPEVEQPELTDAEVELSKRETVHLEEVGKAEASSIVVPSVEVIEPENTETTSRKSSTASSADSVSSAEANDLMEEVQEAKPATIIDEEDVSEIKVEHLNGGSTTKSMTSHVSSMSRPHISEAASSSSSSSSDEEIEKSKSNMTSQQQHFEPSTSPLNGRRSGGSGDVTKIYTKALNNNNTSVANNNNNIEKGDGEPRTKPTRDITQIYTQTLSKTNTPPASPKMAPRGRPATDITKLYTGGLETRSKSPAAAEKLSPRKHNMSTAVDKDAIRRAYDDVRSDTSDTEWAVFKFDERNHLGVKATGSEFADFKSNFGNDERGFGYIRIKTGDEMSKRAKFVLVTWVGPSVSVMKKAKMSTDKALLKDVIQNMSVELQLESHGEFNHDHFKMQVDKASGARYGTGVRDL